MLILTNIWTVLKGLMRKYFYNSTKDGKIRVDGKLSDGHKSVKHYLTCEKAWDKFEMKNMDDSSIGYFLKVDLEYHDELHELHESFSISSRKTCCF